MQQMCFNLKWMVSPESFWYNSQIVKIDLLGMDSNTGEECELDERYPSA